MLDFEDLLTVVFVTSFIAIAIIYFKGKSLLYKKDNIIRSYHHELYNLNQSMAKFLNCETIYINNDVDTLETSKLLINSTAEMCTTLAKRSISLQEKNQIIQRELNKAQSRISHLEPLLKAKIKSQEEFNRITNDRDKLEEFNNEVLSKIKAECALLPSVINWLDKIQEMMDNRNSAYLLEKKNPAPKAYEAVRAAKEESRTWTKKALTLQNCINLYEAQAPWLTESLDYTVEDVIEGLRVMEQESHELLKYEDPVQRYITSSEWHSLSPTERNQIALDRYFEYRQKSAWLAGIAYERYIGYLYEKQGFKVEYQGATLGLDDLGIDLICHNKEKTLLIQCKRLSKSKKYP